MIKMVNATRRPMNVGTILEIQSKIKPTTALLSVADGDDDEKQIIIRTIPSMNSKNAIPAR